MSRPQKFDRPVSVEHALEWKVELDILKEEARYIGDPEHKRNPGHDFDCEPLTHYKRGKTCCDEVNIFSIKTAQRFLREGFSRGFVSPPVPGTKWPKRVWAVTDQGDVLEARLSGNGQYHGFPVLDDSAIINIIKKRWELDNEG